MNDDSQLWSWKKVFGPNEETTKERRTCAAANFSIFHLNKFPSWKSQSLKCSNIENENFNVATKNHCKRLSKKLKAQKNVFPLE